MGLEEPADSFCANCGMKRNSIISKFCANCGNRFDESEQQTVDPVQSQYQNWQNTPQPTVTLDYQRPENYVFTTTVLQRIVGTLKMNIHVVEEIEERQDLQKEARGVLLISLFIISVMESIWIIVFPSSNWVVVNPIGTIVETFIDFFSSGFILIYLLSKLGKAFGGQQTQVDTAEMERALGYAYVAVAIQEVVNIFDVMGSSLLLTLIWLGSWIYMAMVLIFTVRRVLDRGYGLAIITFIIAFIFRFIARIIILFVLALILGDTWYII